MNERRSTQKAWLFARKGPEPLLDLDSAKALELIKNIDSGNVMVWAIVEAPESPDSDHVRAGLVIKNIANLGPSELSSLLAALTPLLDHGLYASIDYADLWLQHMVIEIAPVNSHGKKELLKRVSRLIDTSDVRYPVEQLWLHPVRIIELTLYLTPRTVTV